MADVTGMLRIQICYAHPGLQILQDLTVPVGTTLQEAIFQSSILNQVKEIDLTRCRVGIYGKLKSFEAMLCDRDRIEIYRPLIADPKDSRRHRALAKDKKKAH
jgi:putative ubiquitin-RnfH superfamily antitoxin RatB of RatAB toxin-antitoxin module